MYEVKRWPFAGLVLLATAGLVVLVHRQCGDRLLFQSDLWSLFAYVGAGACLIGLPLLLATAAIGRLVSPRVRGFVANSIYYGFAVAVFALCEILLIRYALNSSVHWYHLPLIGGVAVLAAAYGSSRDELFRRLEVLGYLGAVVLLVGLPCCLFWNHTSHYLARQQATDSDSKHLLLVVLDAFPAQFLRSYNDRVEITPMDRALAEAQIFRELRTAKPFTNGYFGTLYSGKVNSEQRGIGSPLSGGNLLSTLHNHGVTSRWISYHRNGHPECCSEQIHEYPGLRSYFLTENYTWIPDLLGLNYHISIRTLARKKLSGKHKMGQRIWNSLNPAPPADELCENILTESMLPELRKMRSRGGNTFTIFHQRWTQVSNDAEIPQRGPEFPGGKLEKLVASENYRYGPEQEPRAAAARDGIRRRMHAVGLNFAEFVEELRSDPLLKDTTVIVTADHGTMRAKGRKAYGYHPNQEVVKVLCAVLHPDGRRGVDDRRFTTPDLTASICDYFGLRSEFRGPSFSLFDDGPGREFTTTLTLNATLENEWWLVLVKDQKKYWVNLSPEGQGEMRAFQVNTFDELETEIDPAERDQNIPLVQHALKDFGIALDEVHPAFANPVQSASHNASLRR